MYSNAQRDVKLGDVYFNKRTPLVDEIAKVESLIKRGAKLITSPIRKKKFENMGHKVTCTYEEALKTWEKVPDFFININAITKYLKTKDSK